MLFEKLLNIAPLETGDMENELSLEKQMEEEIAMEAAIDDATFETVAFESVAALDVCENILIAMAEKECAVEGADAVAVYESFGMEAAKDVLARKAYAGLAAIKALISTLIGWFKKLLGLSVNMKKVGKSLAEKAKKIRKEMNKAAAKVGQNKEVAFEIHIYTGQEIEDATNFSGDADELDDIAGYTTLAAVNQHPITIQTPEQYRTNIENIEEHFKDWKDNTRERTNMELMNDLSHGLSAIVSNRNNFENYNRVSERAIKSLTRLQNELSRDTTSTTADINTSRTNLTNAITRVNRITVYINKRSKQYVNVADILFTECKKFIAKVM